MKFKKNLSLRKISDNLNKYPSEKEVHKSSFLKSELSQKPSAK